MNEDILNLMDERSKYKKINLNRTIHNLCIEAKERWVDERCIEVEQLEQVDQNRMYEKVKTLLNTRKTNKNIAIMDKEGRVLMEPVEEKARWEE